MSTHAAVTIFKSQKIEGVAYLEGRLKSNKCGTCIITYNNNACIHIHVPAFPPTRRIMTVTDEENVELVMIDSTAVAPSTALIGLLSAN